MIRRGLGAVVALVLMVGTAALSQVPWTPAGGDESVLRLSWRVRGASVERCTPLSDQAAAARPDHMRGAAACRREGLSYRLKLEVDGRSRVDRVVAPSGIRGDRPIFVFHEERLAPGVHRVRVEFTPVDSLPRQVFDGHLRLQPRAVALLTLDPESGDLVLRGRGEPVSGDS